MEIRYLRTIHCTGLDQIESCSRKFIVGICIHLADRYIISIRIGINHLYDSVFNGVTTIIEHLSILNFKDDPLCYLITFRCSDLCQSVYRIRQILDQCRFRTGHKSQFIRYSGLFLRARSILNRDRARVHNNRSIVSIFTFQFQNSAFQLIPCHCLLADHNISSDRRIIRKHFIIESTQVKLHTGHVYIFAYLILYIIAQDCFVGNIIGIGSCFFIITYFY